LARGPRRRAHRQVRRDLGYWSHFVGDGSQPLHATTHFNGWGDYPNPQNFTRERIHAPFEGTFVKAALKPQAVRAAMRPYRDCRCTIQQATVAYLQGSAAKVEPLYRLWGEGGFQGTDPRGTAFVVERVADGASQLRDFVVDAWRASANAVVGYPAVAVRSIEESGRAPYDVIYGRE